MQTSHSGSPSGSSSMFSARRPPVVPLQLFINSEQPPELPPKKRARPYTRDLPIMADSRERGEADGSSQTSAGQSDQGTKSPGSTNSHNPLGRSGPPQRFFPPDQPPELPPKKRTRPYTRDLPVMADTRGSSEVGSSSQAAAGQSGHRTESPDFTHSHNPFGKSGPQDPYVKSNTVVGLTKKTFCKFLRTVDAAFVLFYDPCNEDCVWAKNNIREASFVTQRPNHAYAAVDCTNEYELCKKHGVATFPTMKLYARGRLVNTWDVQYLNTGEIRSFVENTPSMLDMILGRSSSATK